MSLVDDDHDPDVRMARSYLRDVNNIKVGVYEVRGVRSVRNLELPNYVSKLLKKQKWETVAKVRDDNEVVYVLYKQHRQTIKQLFVLSLSRRELVMVQAEGRLDRLFEKVMEEHADLGNMFTDI